MRTHFAQLLVAALIVLAPGLVSGQSAKQKNVIEQEITKLDLAHADAILRGDLAALDKLWTKDFRVNNPFNEVDKADRIRTGAVTHLERRCSLSPLAPLMSEPRAVATGSKDSR